MKVLSSEELLLCTVIILCVSSIETLYEPVDELPSWSVHAEEHGQLVFHQEQISFDLIPFIFISPSSSSLSPTTRIHFLKHIITCAPVHIILRF